MKAAYINETGPADNIIYGDLDTPEPTGTQVRVKVGAVSLNPVDTYLRAGTRMELPMPYILGCDLAGVVDAAGPDASRFKPGDRVWGTNQGLLGRQGTFAEYAAVDEAWLYPTPEGVSDEDAAAISLVGMTAHLGLFQRANLQAGETLCVIGGSGGVGSAVVQMAKAAGARVITTAGGQSKADICRELGADEVIDYKQQDIGEALQQLAPDGVNVFWETRREPDFELAVGAMADRGRMVLMAGSDAKPTFPVGPFYTGNHSVLGFVMFKFTADEQRRCAQDINRWLAESKLRPRIDRVMPLSEAAEAHRIQERSTVEGTGELAGKIVLRP